LPWILLENEKKAVTLPWAIYRSVEIINTMHRVRQPMGNMLRAG
jgi:hypothetical protein